MFDPNFTSLPYLTPEGVYVVPDMSHNPFSTPEVEALRDRLKKAMSPLAHRLESERHRNTNSAKEPRVSIETHTFNRHPVTVEAVQITAENMLDVSQWCGGKVVTPESDERYIDVPVQNPRVPRHGQGRVGDWVVLQVVRTGKYNQKLKKKVFKDNDSFRVFPDFAFRQEFVDASLDPNAPAPIFEVGTPIFDAVVRELKLAAAQQELAVVKNEKLPEEHHEEVATRIFKIAHPVTPKDGINETRPV